MPSRRTLGLWPHRRSHPRGSHHHFISDTGALKKEEPSSMLIRPRRRHTRAGAHTSHTTDGAARRLRAALLQNPLPELGRRVGGDGARVPIVIRPAYGRGRLVVQREARVRLVGAVLAQPLDEALTVVARNNNVVLAVERPDRHATQPRRAE